MLKKIERPTCTGCGAVIEGKITTQWIGNVPQKFHKECILPYLKENGYETGNWKICHNPECNEHFNIKDVGFQKKKVLVLDKTTGKTKLIFKWFHEDPDCWNEYKLQLQQSSDTGRQIRQIWREDD